MTKVAPSPEGRTRVALLMPLLLLLAPGCYEPISETETETEMADASSGAESSESTGSESASGETTADTSADTDTDPTDTGAPPESGFGREIVGGGTADGFSTIPLTIGGEEYKVLTNPWGGATQTITAGGGAVFTVDSITHPGGGNDWDVAAFPSVFKGMSYGGESTANSGLPLAITDITHVYTGLQNNALAADYQGNATYDVYFTNSEFYDGGPPDTYLMVWFDAKGLNPINTDGEGWSCGANPPTYIQACSGAGETTIAGKKFYRFFGANGNATVISYAPETRMEVWEFDLAAFIQDSVDGGALTEDMYLQSVQAGFELADAGAGLTVEDFYIDIL